MDPVVDRSLVSDRPQFAFTNATDDDVFLSLRMIKSNAAGVDGIPLKFIRLIQPFILSHVTYLFNQIIMRSSFPKLWKMSKVLPTHKKTRNFGLTDFRAIHLIPVLSKALENYLTKQIASFVASFKLLRKNVSGFRPGHSTTTALLKIVDDILRSFGRREITCLMLLDYTKAFDTVSHVMLRRKLQRNFYFEVSALNLISSFLDDRSHCVQVGGYSSQFLPVYRGLPQGSVLSPLLFSLFVNDLPDVLQRSVPHMYADDTQAYVSAKRDQVSVNGCIGELRSDFDRISEWSKDNELDLNPRKTKVICFNNSNLSAIIPDFVVGGKVIERSDTVENIGLLMSGNMSWRAHCDRVSSRVFAGLRSLWVHGNVTSRVMRINLVKSSRCCCLISLTVVRSLLLD